MLTIFTIPKPFTKRHINVIQQNAIKSWLKLRPKPEIILVGNEKGIEKIVKKFNLRHIKKVKRNRFRTPLLSDAFNQVRKMSENNILCYINADIILLPDFSNILRHLPQKEFLIVGQRWNLKIKRLINFDKVTWEKGLKEEIEKQGQLCKGWGSDYFVFRKNSFKNLPDFAVGRVKWDNWMIYEARRQKMVVIDATKTTLIVHQNHDYSHQHQGWNKDKNIEAQENLLMAGGEKHVFLLKDANYVLDKGNLKKKKLTGELFFRKLWYWKNTPEIMPGPAFFWQVTKPLGTRLYFYFRKFFEPALLIANKVLDDSYIKWLSFANAGMLNQGNPYCFDLAVKNLPSKKPVLEIGCFCGLSTNIITYLLRKHGKINKVITVDKWIFEGAKKGKIGESTITHEQYRNFIKQSFVRNIKTFSFFNLPYNIEHFSDDFFRLWFKKKKIKDVFGRTIKLGGKISFCYIDGNHQYEFVKRDFKNTDKILEKGGFIFFDDSADNGVFEAKIVAQEVLKNTKYKLVCKNPNYLFQKIK